MGTLVIASDLAEERADFFTAYVATWSEQRRDTAFSTPAFAGAYSILLAGRGCKSQHWGAGYAMSDDALRAFAVERLLYLRPEASGMVVHTKGLIDQISLPDGHVRKARSRPGHTKAGSTVLYDAFSQMDLITTAMDEGRWILRPVTKRNEPDGFRLAEFIATTSGREAAERHRAMFDHLVEMYPRNHIIATDEDPEPFAREAAE